MHNGSAGYYYYYYYYYFFNNSIKTRSKVPEIYPAMSASSIPGSITLLFFFTLKFLFSKSEALLSMAGDFPALLKGVKESPIFPSSPALSAFLAFV